MKKFLILMLVFMMAGSLVFADFSDVTENHWAYEYIENMIDRGVVSGYEDGSFKPDNSVTRAETARMLCDIADLPEGEGVYADVTEDLWYYEYARDCGVYMDCKEQFNGDAPMTREGLASALVLILGAEDKESTSAEGFADFEDIKNPAAVSAAVDAGFVSGYEDGTFRPEGEITRGELCSMLARAFPEDSEEEAAPSEEAQWKLTKITDARIVNFQLDAALMEKGELVYIGKDEEELLFKIDLPGGKTQWETMWYPKRFFLKADNSNSEVGYSDFTAHSVFYDDSTGKTMLFGMFGLYTDENGLKNGVKNFTTLDITYSLEEYAPTEEGKVQYKQDDDYLPELLYVHGEKYTVVFDGKSSVYRFYVHDGTRQGKMYGGDEDTFIGFLSSGEAMYGIDSAMNLVEYDFGNMVWKEPVKTFDADVMGVRDGRFWLWNTEEGTISSSTPDGKGAVVHKGVTFDNIITDYELDPKAIDTCMKVYDKNTFILYDGKALLKLEKI